MMRYLARFWICMFPFLMILFLPKFTIKVTILIDFFVDFPVLDGDDPCSTSYGVYISQLIIFARASSHVADFNTWNIRNFFNKVIGIINFAKRFFLILSQIL